jgi:hypothetical protein
MGIGFTIDTPIKVAQYGISSVVSIMEDHLIEVVRESISKKFHKNYKEISIHDFDYRAKRITAYLNLLQEIVSEQISLMKEEKFEESENLTKYFNLLPDEAFARKIFLKQQNEEVAWVKEAYEAELRNLIIPGRIEVNIMTKLDKLNHDKNGELMEEKFSDASTALRGFCESNGSASVVLSAGMNPRLFAYCEEFDCFFPNTDNSLDKKIILKVSDYRSAYIQGKIFAKKGIWISEYRIESGLNCGGHAFATQGLLLGPILEEFKTKKNELLAELFEECNNSLKRLNRTALTSIPETRITVQGGIGTNNEDQFLQKHYLMDGTGWGSPFLLVPETTNVDEPTIKALVHAEKTDYYLSQSSPLGVRFNNFKKSSAQTLRQQRIDKNQPGSPCYKEFLVNNTEFTEKPICTASRQYQKLKLEQIANDETSEQEKKINTEKVLAKECLCEGLGTSTRLVMGTPLSHKITAVSICPGPNLYYFNGTYKLAEMADHIYGRISLPFKANRPHMFINEAQLYIDYLKEELVTQINALSSKQMKYYIDFKKNLTEGMAYYKTIAGEICDNSKLKLDNFLGQLEEMTQTLELVSVGEVEK